MRKRKAQVSIEYLFVIGLAMAIIIPGSMLFYNYSRESNEQLVSSQINRIGKNIINNAEEMYVIGKHSRITLDANLPETVESIFTTADGSELVITYNTPRGLTESVFFSDVKINGSSPGGNISSQFHSGMMQIKIESKGDYILIGEKID